MTGNFTYLPNVEGLAWFHDRVWPRIEASSGAELVVLGPGSDAVSPSGLGLVADLGAALEQASVMVVPLLHGSGTRVKALDGMAHALPVVGTTLGMEGLEVRSGHDCLVADSADAFSGAVLRLLDDPATAARIGAAGRSLVADRYALPVVAAEIVRVLERLLSLPTAQRVPRLVRGLELTSTATAAVVYRPGSDEQHHLNDSAAAVLALVDGQRTQRRIVDTFVRAVGLPVGQATDLVRHGLLALRSLQIVDDVPGGAAPGPGLRCRRAGDHTGAVITGSRPGPRPRRAAPCRRSLHGAVQGLPAGLARASVARGTRTPPGLGPGEIGTPGSNGCRRRTSTAAPRTG